MELRTSQGCRNWGGQRAPLTFCHGEQGWGQRCPLDFVDTISYCDAMTHEEHGDCENPDRENVASLKYSVPGFHNALKNIGVSKRTKLIPLDKYPLHRFFRQQGILPSEIS